MKDNDEDIHSNRMRIYMITIENEIVRIDYQLNCHIDRKNLIDH